MRERILTGLLIAFLLITPVFADENKNIIFIEKNSPFGYNNSFLITDNQNGMVVLDSPVLSSINDNSSATGGSYRVYFNSPDYNINGPESYSLNQASQGVWYSGESKAFFFILIISLVISAILSIVKSKKNQNSTVHLDPLEKVLLAGGHLSISVLLCFITTGMIDSSYYLFDLSEDGLFICLGLIFTLIYIASSSFLLFVLTPISKNTGYNYHFHAGIASLAGVFYTACLLQSNPVLSRMNLLYIPVLLILSLSLLVIVYLRRSSDQTGYLGAGERTYVPGGRENNLGITVFPPELLQNYADVSLAGMGGVAMVFRARRIRDKKNIAIKVPINRDEITGKSFIREIGVWKKLSHKNIVKIYLANILPVPYIEMEYIDRSLGDLNYPLPRKEALEIMSGIAEGLSYAHKMGIVHHDIKPKNILIDSDGIPKLTDWGLCRTAAENFESSNIGFSLIYAAPEQIFPSRYGMPGERTDIYQTGLIFYEILTGQKPVLGDIIEEFSKENKKSEITPVSVLRNDESFSDLDKIIMHCLEKEPGLRYVRMQDLLSDIKKLKDKADQNSL